MVEEFSLRQGWEILAHLMLRKLENLFTRETVRVDDLSFFDYLSPFCILSIEFHCTFSISCKTIPHSVY